MMMMLRPSLSSRRLLQKVVTRTSILHRASERKLPRVLLCNGESLRMFSSKDTNHQEDPAIEATVTFTDDAAAEVSPKQHDTESIDVSEFTQEVPVTMPDMGESTAKVVKWYKEEGSLVKRNDVLCDIETEDFTFGLTVDDEEDGVMGTIVVPASTEGNIDDGDVLCILLHRADESTRNDDG